MRKLEASNNIKPYLDRIRIREPSYSASNFLVHFPRLEKCTRNFLKLSNLSHYNRSIFEFAVSLLPFLREQEMIGLEFLWL